MLLNTFNNLVLIRGNYDKCHRDVVTVFLFFKISKYECPENQKVSKDVVYHFRRISNEYPSGINLLRIERPEPKWDYND